jgi:aryl-phospho-beta-D-glucosidase BglC (GH1 family)
MITRNLNIKNAIVAICCISLFSLECKKSNGVVANPGGGGNINYTTDTAYRTPLSRGINLSNWFNDYSDPSQFSNRFSDAHFALLKQLGFTYVRIPIGQFILFQQNNPSELNQVNLVYVESAVQKAINHGLAVTLNYHTASDDFEKTLPTNTVNQEKLAIYWKAFANYFKKYGTNKMFFEVYNEPHVASNGSLPNTITKDWWSSVQKRLIDSIRVVAPDHFIIAGGEGWNGIDGLKLLLPYKANNIVYNFHFYEPFTFTHQGASWAGVIMEKLRDVPYPSTPQNVAPLITAATDAQVIQYLTWYGNDQWNKTKLESSIKQAVDWAVANNAALICNEFGSYKPFAPAQSRLDLIKDVRTIFEANKIGWAMWEMDEGFGFINYSANNRTSFTTDDAVLQSLGMK